MIKHNVTIYRCDNEQLHSYGPGPGVGEVLQTADDPAPAGWVFVRTIDVDDSRVDESFCTVECASDTLNRRYLDARKAEKASAEQAPA